MPDNYTKSSRELERELDDTRARIDERARELQERLSPGQLFDQALGYVRASQGREFFDNLGRTVRDNPMPIVVTGVGLAWLMSQANSRSQREFGALEHDDGPSLGERARGKLASASERASDMKQRASGAMHSAGDRARSGAHELAEGARRARAGISRAGSGLGRFIDEQPIVAGICGVAFGAALAALLPPTRVEDEWMGEASDELKGEAARKAREGAEAVRERAEEASEHVREAGEGAARSGSERRGAEREPVMPGSSSLGGVEHGTGGGASFPGPGGTTGASGGADTTRGSDPLRPGSPPPPPRRG